MSSRISAALTCLAVTLPVFAPCANADLILVENGVSLAPIVVFEDAPPLTRQAADELSEYIEKVSGARPEMLDGEPDPIPDKAIWVGYQPVLDTLFSQLDFDFHHPEEILIAANENHLVIAGRDRWDPDGLVAEHGGDEGRVRRIVGRQKEYGTANAVYTFLQEHLDVRWLWPGEVGEDIVERDTIRFAPFEHRHHPQFRGRAGIFTFSYLGLDHSYGRSNDWVRRQRLQLDSLEVWPGHPFRDWWERYHEQHLEYFALQPDGTRSGFPGPRPAKLCVSNPAVWDAWMRQVERQLEADPSLTVLNASTNDGWGSGHCICEDCRAWDHPEGEPRSPFVWEGLSQGYVALSDREVTFVNTLARKLRERYPERDLYVQLHAYGHSRPAPVEAVPDDNVLISSVANFLGRPGVLDRGSTTGATERENLVAWSKVAPNLAWRPNMGSPAGWQRGQPDVTINQTIEDLKFVADLGVVGLYFDTVAEHWATQGPIYYVMAQLAWDPRQDAEEMLADYYRRGFGPASETIRAYWDLLEETREVFFSADPVEGVWRSRPGTRGYPDVYDAAFFEKAYGLLDEAAERLADEPPRFGARVAFLRSGLDHTRLIIENETLMAEYREREDPEVAERVRENWRRIERITQEDPYAINWGPIRPFNRRMQGLHPDH